VLFDRGELNFDDPVTKYWPEYGQNGKEATLVRHFLGHTAGLPGFGEQLTEAQLYDWDHVIGVLERQPPWWEPGTQCAYHSVTQGFLVGEVVRRITGHSLGAFFSDAIATPLGADFHIGLEPDHFARTAELLPGADVNLNLAPNPPSGRVQGMPNIMPPAANGDGWRSAELPAVNGHGNARAMVRAQTPVANGGSAFGVDLLRPSTIDQIFREQGEVMGLGVTHGIGYGVKGLFARLMPEGVKSCFWGGLGGSIVLLDHTNRTCMGYAMNQMSLNLLGDARGASLARKFYEGLQ
jgi:CubicO group peptidase (beta-lactamase class C family)